MKLKDPRLLLKPSGSLEYLLARRLNQPSFTTNFFSTLKRQYLNGDGKRVYAWNFTIQLILKEMSLVKCHRRGRAPRYVQIWQAESTADIADSIRAKVEVTYGQKVEQYIHNHPTFAYLFRRFIPACNHPQSLSVKHDKITKEIYVVSWSRVWDEYCLFQTTI